MCARADKGEISHHAGGRQREGRKADRKEVLLFWQQQAAILTLATHLTVTEPFPILALALTNIKEFSELIGWET